MAAPSSSARIDNMDWHREAFGSAGLDCGPATLATSGSFGFATGLAVSFVACVCVLYVVARAAEAVSDWLHYRAEMAKLDAELAQNYRDACVRIMRARE